MTWHISSKGKLRGINMKKLNRSPEFTWFPFMLWQSNKLTFMIHALLLICTFQTWRVLIHRFCPSFRFQVVCLDRAEHGRSFACIRISKDRSTTFGRSKHVHPAIIPGIYVYLIDRSSHALSTYEQVPWRQNTAPRSSRLNRTRCECIPLPN